MPQDEKPRWLDKPENTTRIYHGLWIVCGFLAVVDLFYAKKSIIPIEDLPAFYGLYGFIVCFGLVLACKELRKIVKRDEDYYDR